jgi:hypothetical protein
MMESEAFAEIRMIRTGLPRLHIRFESLLVICQDALCCKLLLFLIKPRRFPALFVLSTVTVCGPLLVVVLL